MAQHTPGPWSAGIDEDAGLVYCDNDLLIADCDFPQGDVSSVACAEREANARLIAAAPDMFNVLWCQFHGTDDYGREFYCHCPRREKLLTDCSKDSDDKHATMCVDGRRAIARATGT